MAVFDQEAQRIVVRVAYDGPARAGKTTNLEQLCQFFTLHRRSELFSTIGVGNRTLFLDWLALEGGVVAGRKLRCQLITVPGQAVLSRRRWYLLEQADVVVFVLDSTRFGLDEARPMYLELDEFCRRAKNPLPLIVQANKQDLLDALAPGHVAHALGAAPASVVPARASTGVGVRETAVLAIRAAADRVQCQVLASGMAALEGKSRTGQELMDAMVQLELSDPRRPLEVVLAKQSRPSSERSNAAVQRVRPVPPSLDTSVPSGHIWPSATGRELLKRVPIGDAVFRHDLIGQVGTNDGSGRADAVIYEAGLWCLKTSGRRQFADADDARDALLRLARNKISLGELLPRNTVLTIQRAADGAYWLWTVTPWLTTLRGALTFAEARSEHSALEEMLGNYADAAIEALRLAQQRGIQLDVHPSNFARVGSRTSYLDDDIESGVGLPCIGHALLQRVEEYAEYPGAVESYVERIVRTLGESFSGEEAEQLNLRAAFEVTSCRTPAACTARNRILEAIDGQKPRGAR